MQGTKKPVEKFLRLGALETSKQLYLQKNMPTHLPPVKFQFPDQPPVCPPLLLPIFPDIPEPKFFAFYPWLFQCLA
ncbi:MAG: hypothetical protein ABI042_14835 [Verrucomicrobiota bacterium]